MMLVKSSIVILEDVGYWNDKEVAKKTIRKKEIQQQEGKNFKILYIFSNFYFIKNNEDARITV